MAFIATMLVLFMVMAIVLIGLAYKGSGNNGAGLMGTVNNSVQSSSTRMQSASAFDLAESGIEYAAEWLSEQPSPPDPFNGKSFCPWNSNNQWNSLPSNASATSRASVNFGTGAFSLMIYPDQANYNNTSNDMAYLIESVGTANGMTQTLQAYIQQTNFGHYAYFTNFDPSNGYWVVGLNSFNGPMHSNDTNNNGSSFTPTNILWYNNKTTTPMFQYLGSDAYTVSAPTINWNKNTIGTTGSPTSSTDWGNVAAGGSNSVHTGTAIVPLPTSSSLQMNAALGGTTAPTTIGATVPNSNGAAIGGIYVHGQATSMTLSVTNSTTQVITITQTDSSIIGANKTVTTTVTINQSTDQTTVATQKGTPPVTTTNTYSGTTNGVVYADSSIGAGNSGSTTNSAGTLGLSGNIADNYVDGNGVTHYWGMTVATPATGFINIDGPLKFNTARNGNNAATADATLGLVTGNAWVDQKDASNNNLSNVEIDGAVLAYNSFQAYNYGEGFTGTFTILGSYIAGQAGIFGEVDMSGNLLAGLAEHYLYDPRLGTRPPPFFPTTGNNYTVISWKAVNATIQ
ncbi:MAG TPA: hypothetical protein VFW40_11165 [Capsulimonadaceae bacterium]|nr:hypothetical protein [Capsulimonadaceae bacterium]